MDNQETSKSVQCIVVTPERAFLDEVVDFVVLPLFDGELGVLPGRLPMIGRLGFGELRTVKEHVIKRYFIDGGFAQVRGNVVTVLTSQAIKAENINLDAANDALKMAQEVMTTTPEAQAAQYKAQQKARAQIRVAHHAGPDILARF